MAFAAAAWLMPIFQISSFVLVAAFSAYAYATYHFGRWKKLGVPYVEPTPLFGSLRDTVTGRVSLTDLVQTYYRRYRGHRYFGMYESRRPMLVLCDPQLVHGAMVREFSSFHDRIAHKVSFEHDKLFDHLVNLRGEQWKSIRAKLSPTFSAIKLKSMLADISECSSRLIVNLDEQAAKNNGIVDISEASAQFTTDTIGRCAFGLDFNSLADPNSDFRRTGRDVFKPTRRSAILNFIRFVGLGRLLDLFRVRGMPDHIFDFFDNLLETTMNQHKSGENSRNDFIALLVKLVEEEEQLEPQKRLFTENIVAANVFIFFIAGFETTASTISYCLYELALNPEVQVKLRENINETLNSNNGKLSYDTLKDLKYMDMVINEAFRLHPPVPVLNRVCTKKYTIPDSNITLNVGERVLIPTYAFHTDPEYYPNPEVFDPDRFSEENKSSRVQGTFLPFGDGPRICIGMRFAMMEVKTGLAEILTKFEVSPCPETQIPIKINPRSILLTPAEPIRLSFKRINE